MYKKTNWGSVTNVFTVKVFLENMLKFRLRTPSLSVKIYYDDSVWQVNQIPKGRKVVVYVVSYLDLSRDLFVLATDNGVCLVYITIFHFFVTDLTG